MTINFLKKYIGRASAADAARGLVEQTYITTTDVVKVLPSRMDVVKISAPNDVWLSLELAFVTAAAGGGIEKSGQLVLKRDNSRVMLKEFNATDLAELTSAKASFAEARDQLLREILPADHVGAGGAALKTKSTKGVIRRGLRFVAPFFAGGVIVVALALMFGPKGQSSTASATATAVQTDPTLGASASPLTAEALSQMLPQSQAPAAWAALPDEQKRVLMEAAQRVASGSKEVNPELAKVLANLNQSSPVGAAATAGRSTPFLSADENRKIAAATQVRTSTGGTAFYAFVDPMCSACQHLEGQLGKLDPKLNFVALPVGFQGGGREQAAAALCAKDKVAAWHLAASVQPVGNKPCAEGFKQVDANNALFLSLGFNATPTLIAPNGRIAQGSADAEQLAVWVRANAK